MPLARYDTTSGGTWYGPWEIASDPTWPGCIGLPQDGGDTRNTSDNDVRPRIAVEPDSYHFWVAFPHSSQHGSQVQVYKEGLQCVDGTAVPITGGTYQSPPVQCYLPNGCPALDGGDGVNGPDGSIISNDQWGPALAFENNANTGNREIAVTWYDTRGDTNNNNVGVWGSACVANDVSGPFCDGLNLVEVSNASSSPAGQTVPWPHASAPWWDYQALAAEPDTFTFLGAWGGDARFPLDGGIWSAVLQ